MVLKRLGLIQIMVWSVIRGNVIHNLRGFYNVVLLRNKGIDPRNEQVLWMTDAFGYFGLNQSNSPKAQPRIR